MTTVGFVSLVLYLWAITPVSAFLGVPNLWASTNNQQSLLSTPSTSSSNYSVGFSLSSSYGAAAVIIDEPNGEKQTITWVVQGDSEYKSVMAKLSLPSSQHLA